MKNSPKLARLTRWLNLPAGVLIALLQRSPVIQVAASAAATIFRSPAANVLKAAITAAASLGVVDTVAGATSLTASSSTSTVTSTSVTTTVGTSTNVAFGVTGTENPPGSWSVSGTLPAGMAFYGTSSGTSGGVASGTLNASTLYLRGTPTAAGSFQVTLMAFEDAGTSGIASPSYSFGINVGAGSGGGAPTITTGPAPQTVTAGASVTFSVVATGTGLTYQWQKNSVAISGATSASLVLSNVQSTDAANYNVVVTDSGGSVTSATAALTVNAAVSLAPVFTTNPVDQLFGIGSPVTFTAVATGSGNTYQWNKDGNPISGATSTTLTLSNIQPGDAGSYTLTATNASGQATSTPGILTVDTPKPGRLINLSVRSQAGTGAQTLIAGFIVSGSGTKPVMIRGSGPTLVNFGVTGVLADPHLDLFQGQTVIASDDSWADDPNQAAIIAANGNKEGTFTLDPKDTIILSPLQPNGYTAQVTGTGGGTGVALVEVFDTDTTAPGDPAFAGQPRLTNISARSQVGTGANILIAGFIINGNMPKTIMIRASGPTLTNFGVTGVLADPILSLFSGSTMVAQNDSWGSASNVAAIMAANGDKEGAFSLDPKDAVLLVTLAPGGYTAQIAGVSGGTGVALIEVFDLQ